MAAEKASDDIVEDAVVVEENGPADAVADAVTGAAVASDAAPADEKPVDADEIPESGVVAEDPKSGAEGHASDSDGTPEAPAEPTSVPLAAMVPTIVQPPRRSGFFPMLLGGVIAAGLGAGALFVSDRAGWIDLGGTDISGLQSSVVEQDGRIAALSDELAQAKARIAELSQAKPDLSGVRAEIADLAATVARQAESLAARIDATDKRLSGLETQPIPKAELPAEVVAAYERKLSEIASAVDEQFRAMQAAQDTKLAAIESRLTGKLTEIEAAQAAASQAELDAQKAAKAAEIRASLAEIDIALDAGVGFAEPLNRLATIAGITAPEALASVAENGAPSLAALQSSYDDAARAALVASTKAAVQDGSVDRMTAFLRTQLGARSLEPREGDDPDAILSRAEAALGKGDLDTTLAEIAKLPQVGQAEMADWVAQAQSRRAAKAALNDLSAQLNTK